MSAPRKTLVLHIGMGKTGTTAIQKTFWANRAALARAGVAYPAVGIVGGAHHLVSPHRHAPLAARAPWRRFLAPADWIPEVQALPEPVVFISSELIASTAPSLVGPFCAAIAQAFDLRVLCYLRRQDDLIAATWAQSVKAGQQRRPLAAVVDSRIADLDYALRLAPWEAALPAGALVLRPYERAQFPAGDLLRDVALHGLGLPDLPPGFAHDPAVLHNSRLPVAALEFKRLVNILMRDRDEAQTFLAPLDTCPPDPPGMHLLGRADRLRIIAYHAASNAAIARRHLGRAGGDLFHAPLPLDAPDTPPAVSAEDLRDLARMVGRSYPALLHRLADSVSAGPQGDPLRQMAIQRLAPLLGDIALPPKPLAYRLGVDLWLGRVRSRAGGLAARALPLRSSLPTQSQTRLTTAARAGSAPSASAWPPKDHPAILRPTEITAQPPAPITFPEGQGQEMLVHFGPRKTGSSSIQETLFRYPDQLAPLRYLAYGMANGSLMVRDVFVAPDSHPFPRREMIANRFAAGVRDIAAAPRAIFSAETISDLDVAGIERLIGALSAHGARIAFVGYLREPVSYLRSLFQEQIKYSYPGGFPFGPGADLKRNYHLVVDRLDRVAGRDRVHIYPFERAVFPQGDVVRHFLAVAGIDAARLTINHVNESLSATAVKALFTYRRLRLHHDADLNSNTTRESFIARLATLRGPSFHFAPEIEIRIAASNTHILDWSARRMGHRLAVPLRNDGEGIRCEADLAFFSVEELDRIEALARAEGIPGLPAGTMPANAAEAVADLMHRLRLQAASSG